LTPCAAATFASLASPGCGLTLGSGDQRGRPGRPAAGMPLRWRYSVTVSRRTPCAAATAASLASPGCGL